MIATFSHQLTHNETPNIETDGTLKLIYAGELADEIWKIIREKGAGFIHFNAYCGSPGIRNTHPAQKLPGPVF